MNIKDFTVGQTVYVLEEKRGPEREVQTKEYIVVYIGRKYLRGSGQKRPPPGKERLGGAAETLSDERGTDGLYRKGNA